MSQAIKRETRKLNLSFVTIGSAELKRLASLLADEARQAKSEPAKYRIEWKNGSTFESNDPNTFDDATILGGELESVSMAWGRYSDKSIDIYIAKAEGLMALASMSHIEVGGKDSTWVNGVMGRLQQITQQCKNSYAPIHKWPFLLGLAVLCGGAVWSLLSLILRAFGVDATAVISGVSAGGAFYGAWGLGHYIRLAFPNIELRGTGPSRAERRRKILYFIAVAIVIPILLNLIFVFW